MHEEIAEEGALDDCFRADEVGARPDGHSCSLFFVILEALARGEQFADVVELARAVGVGEDDILAPRVPDAVDDGAAFAAVVGQGDEADAAGGNVDGGGGGGGVGPGA